MTVPELIAACRARSLELLPLPPDTIRVRGLLSRLTPDLRDRLRALKPEVLALLRGDGDAIAPRPGDLFGRFLAVQRRIAAWGLEARGVHGHRQIAARWPELWREVNATEARCRAAALVHVQGEAGAADIFAEALAAHEAAWERARALLWGAPS